MSWEESFDGITHEEVFNDICFNNGDDPKNREFMVNECVDYLRTVGRQVEQEAYERGRSEVINKFFMTFMAL